jgi:hypothetical protein
MVRYHCDGCGKDLPKGTLRYTLTIDVKAAYDELEIGLLDLVRDHRDELMRLIKQLQERDVKELEESVYKHFELELCPSCQRIFLEDPLRFSPKAEAKAVDVDIDAFLRSLGYGKQDRPPSREDNDDL